MHCSVRDMTPSTQVADVGYFFNLPERVIITNASLSFCHLRFTGPAGKTRNRPNVSADESVT